MQKISSAVTTSILLLALLTVPALGAYPDGHVAAGGSHSLIIRNNNTVFAFGDNTHGQDQMPGLLNNHILAVAASLDHRLALKGDGSVVIWGDNSHGQFNVPAGLVVYG
jgi:alpha-tubulin suppressor-like RCC1 family protein